MKEKKSEYEKLARMEVRKQKVWKREEGKQRKAEEKWNKNSRQGKEN